MIRSKSKQKAKMISNPRLDEIQNPQKVRILILTQQKLSYQQFSYLKAFQNLIKLDLSYNKIQNFSHGFTFKSFTQLKTLFLHYNKFDRLKNLQVLGDCQKLVYLTLFGNPLEESKVKHFCVNLVKSLKLMDDKPVNEQQRFEGILNLSSKIQGVAKIGFPLVQMPSPQNGKQFLSCVIREINIARNQYLKVNPIVVIQKWWKSKLYTKKLYKQFLEQQEIQSKIMNRNRQQDSIQEKDSSQRSQNFTNKSSPLLGLENNKIDKIEDSSQKVHQEVHKSEKSYCQIIKVIGLVKSLYYGLKSFKTLIDDCSTLICSKKYCLQNGYNFNQIPRYKSKYLHFYKSPQNHPKYKLLKQKSKHFISLIFYNNSHYLLQLKSRKVHKNSQLKNISGQKPTKKQQKQEIQLVEIELSQSQKISLLKKQYFKTKNPKNLQPYPFLFNFYIVKISSAVKIQKSWRGYFVRKTLDVLKKIKEKRAALKIQKWIRNLRFYHRHKFLVKTYEFLKNNNFSNIVISMEIFSKIVQREKEKFRNKNLFMIPFQTSSFKMIEKQNLDGKFINNQDITQIDNPKAYSIEINSDRQPFPSYFSKFVQNFSIKKQQIEDHYVDFQERSNALIDLFIKGTISIIKFQKIIHQEKKQKEKVKKYVRFEFSNKKQANKRKLLICLFTYSFRTQNWIEFHSESSNIKNKQNDQNLEIKQNFFIKIIADTDKSQNLYQKIRAYTNSIQYKGKLRWIPLKLRFFQATTDYSAVLLCGLHKNDLQKQENEQFSQKSYAQKKKLRELRSLKALHAKMILKNLDTHIFQPTGPYQNSNENLMSFSVRLQQNQSQLDLSPNKKYKPQKLVSYHHVNSLNHNSSQYSIDNISVLSKSVHSYGSSLPLKKKLDQSQANDLSMSLDPSMNLKKSQISQTKSIHKEKLQMISQMKKKNNDSLRNQYYTQRQKNHKLLKEKSQLSFIQNLDKVKKIQQSRKAKIQKSFQIDNFQNSFLRKGNLSIQNQIRKFEKHRSHGKEIVNEDIKSKVKKSARYQEKDSQIDQGSISQARRYIKQKSHKKVLKTQLKQFSLNFSDGIELQNSLVQNDLINTSKKLGGRQNLSSAVSEKITKLYNEKTKQFLKSQHKDSVIQQSPFNKDNELLNKLSLQFKSQQIKGQESNIVQKNQIKFVEKRKLLKKKRTVHSVFPEQYYPLKDSHQIGFNLPKINSQKG